MRMVRSVIPVVLLVALAAGCASTGRNGPRTSRDVLTRAELEASSQVTALRAIQQERPHWLYERGTNSIYAPNPIQVYVDGVRSGTIETLDAIPLMSVERMRFYDATEAQARFGLNNTNGAIEVITRKS